MKVSILVPTLNRIHFLQESLSSARQQSYKNLEILVSDDGSSDGSQALVKNTESVDSRIRLLPPNPVPGLFNNLNYLLQNCKGDAFCILADDDRLLPDFVDRLVKPLLKNSQIIASFCDHWVINAEGKQLLETSEHNSLYYGRKALQHGEIIDPLTVVMQGSMCMGFSLYRSSIFKHENFDLDCGGAADFDYAIRAARLGKLYYVKERLGEYRSHPNTITATRFIFMSEGSVRVFSKYSFLEPHHEKLRKNILLSKYRYYAYNLSTQHRRRCLEVLYKYIRLGGNPFASRVILTFLLALLPQAISTWIKSTKGNIKSINFFSKRKTSA